MDKLHVQGKLPSLSRCLLLLYICRLLDLHVIRKICNGLQYEIPRMHALTL